MKFNDLVTNVLQNVKKNIFLLRLTLSVIEKNPGYRLVGNWENRQKNLGGGYRKSLKL